MDACPSTFALDDADVHGGAVAAGIARHLDGCARCRTRADERKALGQRFDAALAAPLWNRVDVARRRSRRWFWGLGPALAVAALAIVLVARPGPTYRATKGDFTVEVAARRAGTVFPVEGATEVRSGDELQFIVRAGGPAPGRYVLIGSVDGTGQFSPFYPASLDGRSVVVPRAGAPLSPPVVLDDAPGPERVVVVLSERPLDVRALAPLIQQRAAAPDPAGPLGGGESAVRWLVLTKGEARRMQP